MTFSKTLMLSAAALITMAATPTFAQTHTEVEIKAEAPISTVTTETLVTQKEIPNTRKTNFSAFDLNMDGVLSMKEVGTKLFYVFDTDGNEVIDNIEFKHRQIMTIIPMEENTYTYMDWNSDGATDQATYTYDTFFQTSGLARFDKNMDGLSAQEFIGASMLEMDDDKSGMIEIGEWKEAYEGLKSNKASEQERYQD